MREEVIGDARLILGDCREVLPTLERVDAVVTSPPYWQQRDYGCAIDDWDGIMHPLCSLNTTPNAQVLINLGIVHRNGEIFEYWDGFKRDMRAAGWRYFGQYIWDKGYGRMGDTHGRMASSHELIFHFNKREREATKWVRTQERADIGTGLREADGSASGITSPNKVGQPFKVPDSVIRIGPHNSRGGPEDGHPAVYPVALAAHICKTFSSAAGPILDPFLGSGTTGVAAIRMGRTFIGVELHEPYFDIACRRIEAAYKQADLFVAAPAPKATQPALFGDAP